MSSSPTLSQRQICCPVQPPNSLDLETYNFEVGALFRPAPEVEEHKLTKDHLCPVAQFFSNEHTLQHLIQYLTLQQKNSLLFLNVNAAKVLQVYRFTDYAIKTIDLSASRFNSRRDKALPYDQALQQLLRPIKSLGLKYYCDDAVVDVVSRAMQIRHLHLDIDTYENLEESPHLHHFKRLMNAFFKESEVKFLKPGILAPRRVTVTGPIRHILSLPLSCTSHIDVRDDYESIPYSYNDFVSGDFENCQRLQSVRITLKSVVCSELKYFSLANLELIELEIPLTHEWFNLALNDNLETVRSTLQAMFKSVKTIVLVLHCSLEYQISNTSDSGNLLRQFFDMFIIYIPKVRRNHVSITFGQFGVTTVEELQQIANHFDDVKELELISLRARYTLRLTGRYEHIRLDNIDLFGTSPVYVTQSFAYRSLLGMPSHISQFSSLVPHAKTSDIKCSHLNTTRPPEHQSLKLSQSSSLTVLKLDTVAITLGESHYVGQLFRNVVNFSLKGLNHLPHINSLLHCMPALTNFELKLCTNFADEEPTNSMLSLIVPNTVRKVKFTHHKNLLEQCDYQIKLHLPLAIKDIRLSLYSDVLIYLPCSLPCNTVASPTKDIIKIDGCPINLHKRLGWTNENAQNRWLLYSDLHQGQQ